MLINWIQQGVRSVKQTDLNPVYVLIKPPSLEVLVTSNHDKTPNKQHRLTAVDLITGTETPRPEKWHWRSNSTATASSKRRTRLRWDQETRVCPLSSCQILALFPCLATQPGMFDHVVVNDTVDSAYAQLKALVIEVSLWCLSGDGIVTSWWQVLWVMTWCVCLVNFVKQDISSGLPFGNRRCTFIVPTYVKFRKQQLNIYELFGPWLE